MKKIIKNILLILLIIVYLVGLFVIFEPIMIINTKISSEIRWSVMLMLVAIAVGVLKNTIKMKHLCLKKRKENGELEFDAKIKNKLDEFYD